MNGMGSHDGSVFLVAGTTHPDGPEMPDVVRMLLVDCLRDAGAEVDCLTIPFAPGSDDDILADVTAWGLMDIGRSGKRYHAVLSLGYPANHLDHPRKIALMTTDYRPVLDRFGKGGPLLLDSPENQERRLLLLRLMQKSLTAASAVFCASAMVRERLAEYCGIHGEVVDFLVERVITSPAPGIGISPAVDGDGGAPLVACCHSQAIPQAARVMDLLSSSPWKPAVVFMVDSSDTKTILSGLAASRGLSHQVTTIARPDERTWDRYGYAAGAFLDCRAIEEFNPLVIEACHRRRPLVLFPGSAWSEAIVTKAKCGLVLDRDGAEDMFLARCASAENWRSFCHASWTAVATAADTLVDTVLGQVGKRGGS